MKKCAEELRKVADCLNKLAYPYTRRTFYKNDPFWMRAKYDGLCAQCKDKIKKGDQMWYYPKDKITYCEKCGKGAEQDFLAAVHDEEFLSGGSNW